jgi:hypothetical protein
MGGNRTILGVKRPYNWWVSIEEIRYARQFRKGMRETVFFRRIFHFALERFHLLLLCA